MDVSAAMAVAVMPAKMVELVPSESTGNQGVANTLIRGSTNATYLAARLKRDHPEIAAAAERGEYPSMRQAAIAAGIVKQPSDFDKLTKLPAERVVGDVMSRPGVRCRINLRQGVF